MNLSPNKLSEENINILLLRAKVSCSLAYQNPKKKVKGGKVQHSEEATNPIFCRPLGHIVLLKPISNKEIKITLSVRYM